MYYDIVESGKRIKEMRKKAGMTQAELAEKLGIYITDKVFIALTQEDILELTNSLKEYTLSLARERNYCIKDKESLDYTGNVITCFLNNIQVQKEIISEVA